MDCQDGRKQGLALSGVQAEILIPGSCTGPGTGEGCLTTGGSRMMCDDDDTTRVLTRARAKPVVSGLCAFLLSLADLHTMPKNIQNSNSASRHSLRRNQVSPALNPLTPSRCAHPSLFLDRPVSPVASGSWYYSPLLSPLSLPLSLTIAFRDVMLHVLTVPPASSTSDRRIGLPLPNMTFWQAMAGSDQRPAATRIRVSRLSIVSRVILLIIPL